MTNKPGRVPEILAAVGEPADADVQRAFDQIGDACRSDAAYDLGNYLTACLSQWANRRPDGSVKLIDIMAGALNAAAWTAADLLGQAAGKPGVTVERDAMMEGAASMLHYLMLERAGETEGAASKVQNAPTTGRRQ